MSEDNVIEINIMSDPRMLCVVRGAVERLAEVEGFCESDLHGLAWAVDEALANVIKHGYAGRTDQPIRVTLQPVRNAQGRPGIAVEIRDQGRSADPCTIKSRALEDIRPGGLGVHVIRTVMDECAYSQPKGGGMLLRMVKYKGAGGAVSSEGAGK